ncbi:hypothetical protein BGZ76_002531 [Entomortierella beljakovae]|nr:hypothetical protein BGZ76_002531 [Entomortierella beljakovae]
MTSEITLFCIVDADSTAFSVDILPNKTVDHLKKKIKEEQSPLFDDIRAQDLNLWHVSIPMEDDDEDDKPVLLENHHKSAKRISTKKAATEISDIFGTAPSKNTIHVIVQRPSAEDLEITIKRITARFFAHDSPASIFLNEYVKGEKTLSTTTEGIIGLPRAWRRGKTSEPTLESRPNFLFLDLPETPSHNSIPDQFRSNVILSSLENTEARDVPVFGVGVERQDRS